MAGVGVATGGGTGTGEGLAGSTTGTMTGTGEAGTGEAGTGEGEGEGLASTLSVCGWQEVEGQQRRVEARAGGMGHSAAGALPNHPATTHAAAHLGGGVGGRQRGAVGQLGGGEAGAQHGDQARVGRQGGHERGLGTWRWAGVGGEGW